MVNKRKYFGVALTFGAAALALGVGSTGILPTVHGTQGFTISAKAAYDNPGYWDAINRLPADPSAWPGYETDYTTNYNSAVQAITLKDNASFTTTLYQPIAGNSKSGYLLTFNDGGTPGTGTSDAASSFNQQWATEANKDVFFTNWNESTNSYLSSPNAARTSYPNSEIPPLIINGGVLHVDANGNVLQDSTPISPATVAQFVPGWDSSKTWPMTLSSGSPLPDGTTIGMKTETDGSMVLPTAAATDWVKQSNGAHFLYCGADLKVTTGTGKTVKETFVIIYVVNQDAQASVNVKNTTIPVGSSWSKADNFVSGTTVYNTDMTADDTTTSGSVDTSKAGTYNVDYTYHAPSGDITKTATVTVYNPSTGGGTNNGGGNTGSSTSSSSSSSAVTTNPGSGAGGTTTETSGTTVPSTIDGIQKNSVVYATKGIYLYSKPTFEKANRRVHYPAKPRSSRPMFLVKGTAYSKNGVLRYYVKNTDTGKTGYITANKDFVSNVYYQTVPKDKTITVWSKGGLNEYKKSNLTGKVRHYKKGAHVKVTKLVKHNLTTRYELSNGHFVSANKRLVYAGKH